MRCFLIMILTLAISAVADWSPPDNMGQPINSDLKEYNPTIVSGGSYLIYTILNKSGGIGGADLWRSDYDFGNEVWQTPVNLGSNVNTSAHDSTPYLAESDTELYYTSKGSVGSGNWDVWWCTISGDGVVGSGVNIGSQINTSDTEHSPVLSSDGMKLYFGSNRSGGFGGDDIWVSEYIGGVWEQPTNIGGDVNTAYEERPQWLSDDDNTLVFASNQPGTIGGYDLWYTTNNGSSWGAPANFGSIINSTSGDYGCTFVNNGGQIGGTIIFGSGRSGGYGDWDLYKSTWNGTNIKSASLGHIKAVYK